MKKIGLETSSIMPLLETTPRTLPLQRHIKETIDGYDVVAKVSLNAKNKKSVFGHKL